MSYKDYKASTKLYGSDLLDGGRLSSKALTALHKGKKTVKKDVAIDRKSAILSGIRKKNIMGKTDLSKYGEPLYIEIDQIRQRIQGLVDKLDDLEDGRHLEIKQEGLQQRKAKVLAAREAQALERELSDQLYEESGKKTKKSNI
jgi:hypothetical protein